jgi:lysylphosphatidylglycerol synthetase-like protein (DUF2156 family)
MNYQTIVNPLAKALKFYAVLALVIVIFQGIGLLMYLVNVWPGLGFATPSGGPVSDGVMLLLVVAVVMGFARSFVWIRIYWDGATAFRSLGGDAESAGMSDRRKPVFSRLTRLLVASCILDVLFLPAYFLSDVFLPFPIAGWRLGVVEVARVVFPQAFGFASLILAFITHQYGRLLDERGRMKNELDLTI